jgi:nucleotide-binding universal stress UspA family protein
MFEKILVCLDQSPEAEEILPYIYEEAAHFTKVVLLSVLHTPGVQLPVSVPGESAGLVQTSAMMKKFKQAMDETPAYLEAKARPLREKGIDVETVVLQGIPSESILDYIRENEVKLLAIATHGHSGFREIALGSTAEYLLRHSGLPVLIVTPKKRKKIKKS